jgi:universal stress protein E
MIMDTILAVINNWPDADRIVATASRLADALGCDVTLYCPVSNAIEEMNRYIGYDNYEAMKEELVAESRTMMAELEGVEAFDSVVEWQPVPYRAVIEKAQLLSVGMIIVAASEHSMVGDLMHKPDDWHLLRDAHCPVWVLGKEGGEYRRISVAIDVLSDEDEMNTLNGRVLDQAKMLAELYRLPLRVVSVVPDPATLYSDLAVTDSDVMADFRTRAESLVSQRQKHVLELFGIQSDESEVLTGQLEQLLRSVLAEDGVLVVGTSARKGLRGFFLGNTAERLLVHLRGDMLVVS